MKKPLLTLLLFLSLAVVHAQINNADTGYTTRISTLKWMPDGKAILLDIVKHHKTDQQAPFFSKVFLYTIGNKKMTFLFDDGSNLTTSPDGKRIAFFKRSENKRSNIYFYDIATKKQTVLQIDTLGKHGLTWSPDGKMFAYNMIRKETGKFLTDIAIYDLSTRQAKQITKSCDDAHFDPQWNPDSKRIVYYLEKGDGRDQIWLTDMNGSFHTNLTNDTTTHNYFPSWIDDNTIIYTQSPDETLMVMNADGSNRRKIEGINATPVKYNAKANQLIYIKSEKENKLMLYDWKKKAAAEIMDGTQFGHLF